MQYSENFKDAAVAKMATPGGRSATSLSHELGVSQSSLSRWLRERVMLGGNGAGAMRERAGDWTPEQKVEAILEFEKLSEEQRGVFLREKGLHEATLAQWKAEIIEAMKLKPFVGGKKDPQQKRIAALDRELIDRVRMRTREEAEQAVFEFIEGWYNPHRRHSSLNYECPIGYEEKHWGVALGPVK